MQTYYGMAYVLLEVEQEAESPEEAVRLLTDQGYDVESLDDEEGNPVY